MIGNPSIKPQQKEVIDLSRFFYLCNPHNSIIQKFGVNASCNKPASICKQKCQQYEHSQKIIKHQFIDSKAIYYIFANLRSKFQQFRKQYVEVYFKKYCDELRKSIDDFETYFQSQCGMVAFILDIFVGGNLNSNEDVRELFTEDLPDIQFADLSCKDIYCLKNFSEGFSSKHKELQSIRSKKVFQKLLQKFLKEKNLLKNRSKTKKEQVFKVDKLEQMMQKMKNEISIAIEMEQNLKIENLTLKIEEDLSERQNLKKYFGQLQQYIMLHKIQQINIFTKSIVDSEYKFWNDFKKLVERVKVKKLRIVSSKAKPKKGQFILTNSQIEFDEQYEFDWEKGAT